MKQQIIVLEQRIEGSETMVMTHVHKESTNAPVSKEEMMVFLLPHVDELKGNLEELRSKMEGQKGDWKDLKGPKKDLRCIKCEVKNET
jgi:archaellum component FlaC